MLYLRRRHARPPRDLNQGSTRDWLLYSCDFRPLPLQVETAMDDVSEALETLDDDGGDEDEDEDEE